MTRMNAVGWFDIYVDDMERAVAFYEAMLGSSLDPMDDPTGETQMMSFPAEMSSYGAGGALTKAPYAAPGIGGTVLYFMVDDCAVQQQCVAEAAGSVVRPKFSIGDFGWVLLCKDTEGNIVGFNSMK
jgi:uncharacterized protein